ncbi:possible pectin degradation protein [Candidatus Moduliflexus flocculans]|uniref:Possible pectin degradation protein n=1 Tax=Candidatus Moduliflexus flocculans TaxID=1499966 RepID=A0A0S6VVU1_9BACT|nr:possible pectin degradation protein [Candidatus Moduliflexus flocculans]
MAFFDMTTIPARALVQGISMKAVYGEQLMLMVVDLEAGAVLPAHHHHHEQMGMVLEGELHFTIGEETKICSAGDTYLIPSNVIHSVTVSKAGPAKVLDVFNPPREDYK